MKYYNYKDLGITSAKLPFNTHLFWEHSTYGFIMVDSTNQSVLLFSTKARLLVDGSDWDVVDLSDNTYSYKIQAGWLDGNDLWLVMCDNDGTADRFEVCYIELDDSNDCNTIGVSIGADSNSVYVWDIFKIDGTFHVVDYEAHSITLYCVVWDVNTAPLTIIDETLVRYLGNLGWYGIVAGTTYYSFGSSVPGFQMTVPFWFDYSTSTITVSDADSELCQPLNLSQIGVSYDGDNTLYLLCRDAGDGDKIYLISYSI